jgi:4a-hydroxytetrahydrobiopterin dehydratase
MENLTQLKCVPCRGGVPTLTDEEVADLLPQVPEWDVVEREGIQRIERLFKTKNFAEALAFTNQVGALAEEEGHHPAILTEWGKVTVTLWTHAIKGLHQNDFIMAAKINKLFT